MPDNDDESRLRAESAEIENLLGEVQALVAGPAWQRVERLLGRVTQLYAAGLARALAHARAAGATGDFDERVAGDELLASLLVLHGLHPLAPAERVRRALAVVRAELDLADDELVLADVGEQTATIRAHGPLGGGAMATRVAEAAIRRALENAAPELTTIDIAGLPDPSLIQLRVGARR